MNSILYAGYVHGPEFGADDHYAWRARITRRLLRRVERLAQAAKQLRVWAIEDWDGSVEVFRAWPTDLPALPVGVTQPESADPDEPFDAEESRVGCDGMKLVVHADGDFYWEWYPHHWDGNDHCNTDVLNLRLVRKDWQQFGAGRAARAA